MNWEQFEDRWNQFAGSAHERWSKLTDEDWRIITGQKEQLVERVQKRYGIAKKEAEREVDEWSLALEDVVLVSKTH